MAKAEVVIDEKHCLGCGYCELLCPQGCLVLTGEKLTSEGYVLPTLSNTEKCNGCGICAQMCPAFAIEVYRTVEPRKKSKRHRRG